MRIGALMFTALALGTATPAMAQQRGATMSPQDQQALQEAKKLVQEYEDAYARKDAQAIANQYADNAIYSTPWYTAEGKQAILRNLQEGFKQDLVRNLHNTAEQSRVIDPDHTWTTGTWTADLHQAAGVQQLSGHWMTIAQREGGEWKILADFSNIQAAPPLVGTSAPPATNK